MNGFTLIEMVIVIAMMSALTGVVVTGLPAARTSQLLEGDIQRLRSVLSQAQQRALNEIRDQECLDQAGADIDNQRYCSDVGVAILNQRLVMFADLNGDQDYTEGVDYLIEEQEQASSVVGETQTIVFAVDPPTVITYANAAILSAAELVEVTIRVGQQDRQLSIGPYGIIHEIE